MKTHAYNQTCKPIVTMPHIVFALSAISVRVRALLFSCRGTVQRCTYAQPGSDKRNKKACRACSTGNVAHASRLLFQPGVVSLPSARHSSQVIGFLKSNLPPAFLRNCDRGKLRSHTWHMMGFAAASMDACALFRFAAPGNTPCT